MTTKPPRPPPVRRASSAPPAGASVPHARSVGSQQAGGPSRPARPQTTDSVSGATRPDARVPDFPDEVTIPRRNPYALPPKGYDTDAPEGSAPKISPEPYEASADDIVTAPGSPRGARRRSSSETETLIDNEPPTGVRTERQAAKLYDELYDAVNTDVTRTELLWGLTSFAKRRLQSFRKRQHDRKQAALTKLDGRSAGRARPLGMTLVQYVSILGLRTRLWVPAVFALLITAAVTATLVMLEVRRLVPNPPTGAPAVAVPTQPAATTAMSASARSAEHAQPTEPDPVMPLADRAAAGDAQAVTELQQRSPGERTAEETAALDRAKLAQHLQSLEELRAQFAAQPTLVSDPEWMSTLRAFIAYERTSTDALLVAATLPGEAGPDLLYEVWTRTGKTASTVRLAKQLLYARDVRPKASTALAAALDLYDLAEQKRIDECDALLEALERAADHGDARCLRPIGLLHERKGCGEKKQEDCYPCLRDGAALTQATRAVRGRPAPTGP